MNTIFIHRPPLYRHAAFRYVLLHVAGSLIWRLLSSFVISNPPCVPKFHAWSVRSRLARMRAESLMTCLLRAAGRDWLIGFTGWLFVVLGSLAGEALA